MGKRSRKRPAPPPAERREPVAAQRTPPAPMSRRARLEEAPKPPWHPFPLVELCILGGLVLMVVGFLKGGIGGGLFAVCDIALVVAEALELATVDLFGDKRSHSSPLADALGVWAL